MVPHIFWALQTLKLFEESRRAQLCCGKLWPSPLLWPEQQCSFGWDAVITTNWKSAGSGSRRGGSLKDFGLKSQVHMLKGQPPVRMRKNTQETLVSFASLNHVTVFYWTVVMCAAATAAIRLCHNGSALFVDKRSWGWCLCTTPEVSVWSCDLSGAPPPNLTSFTPQRSKQLHIKTSKCFNFEIYCVLKKWVIIILCDFFVYHSILIRGIYS